MVECHASAIRYHPVDELELFGMKGQSAVPGVQFPASIFRQVCDCLVKNVVLMNCYDPEAPACATEILRIGIHAYGVVWNFGHYGAESRHKGPVHVVGHHD